MLADSEQDAAVAVAAALNITEPSSTGIGGDMFCLYWDAKTKKVRSLNGSGRAPKNTTVDQIRKELDLTSGERGSIPLDGGLSVTVPGAAAGWCDVVERFGSGKVTLEQILTPAIELGENGFPVSELSASFAKWKNGESRLRDASPNFREMLRRDPNAEHFARAPRAGEIMQIPTLARTFRTLATEGKKGFYTGRIAKSIVDVVKMTGGHLELDDLEDHLNKGSEETTPIHLTFTGQNIGARQIRESDGSSAGHTVDLWEHPPNGQGIVALMALGIFEELEKSRKIRMFAQEDHNCADYLHAVIESLRIALIDASWWVTDSEHSPIKPAELISRSYLTERAKLFDAQKAQAFDHGEPSPAHNHCDTVYFCVTDKEGNGMSFINSVYTGFGSAIIPEGCGFNLQNRGANFVLGPPDHPNIYAGGKRPYHTIIPGLLTHGQGDKRDLHSVFGVMGGFMQPQGHVQTLLNMEVFGMNPQQALDAPRICIGAGMPEKGALLDMTVYLEEGIEESTVRSLQQLGHKVQVLQGFSRSTFGRGQIIRRHVDEMTGQVVWSAGSDPRGDGCAIPA
ncbi:hypothetical protein LTR64_001461 [Lithohypha guttulata]|uniref:uncharacterized protein n=1 Tax=Lithohypha guttulata TaxID=1690604 RepID=UPI002DDFC440|nr:hypothetical protein LTR51_003655 [Lithohypha guttulata]